MHILFAICQLLLETILPVTALPSPTLPSPIILQDTRYDVMWRDAVHVMNILSCWQYAQQQHYLVAVWQHYGNRFVCVNQLRMPQKQLQELQQLSGAPAPSARHTTNKQTYLHCTVLKRTNRMIFDSVANGATSRQ